MTNDSATLVLRFWNDVWTRGDVAVMDEIWDEHAMENGESVDREAFKGAITRWRSKFEPFSATVEDVIEVGDRVVTRVTYRGTHVGTWAGLPATHKQTSSTGIDIFTIRDGRIVELWHATDHYDVIVQIGAKIVPGDA